MATYHSYTRRTQSDIHQNGYNCQLYCLEVTTQQNYYFSYREVAL